MTAKLATAASSAVRTPGRRRISASGAGGALCSSAVGGATFESSFGSGRTRNETTRPASANSDEPSHGNASALGRRARGRRRAARRRAGRRSRPKTAPKSTRTSRARGARAGTCRPPRRARASRSPAPRRRSASPRNDQRRRSSTSSRARRSRARRSRRRSRRGSPACARRGPMRARRADRERARDQEDGRPEPEDPLDPGDGDERDGSPSATASWTIPDRQTSPPRRAGSRCGDRDSSAAAPGPTLRAPARRPRRNSAAPPCAGWRTYDAAERLWATRPTGTTRRPRASSRDEGQRRRAISAGSGGGSSGASARMRRHDVPEQHVVRRARARRACGGRPSRSPRPGPRP